MIWRLVFIPSVSYQPFALFASKLPSDITSRPWGNQNIASPFSKGMQEDSQGSMIYGTSVIRLSVIASADGAVLMHVTVGLLGGSASGFPECAHLANRRRAGP